MSKKTAVGYSRLSQTSDTSISDQQREIRQLTDGQGFDLLRIYDDGQRSSGFDADRPEYLEMQATLKDEDVDAVVVRDRDRLSRDKRERSMLYYDLDEWGVELWTTKDGECVELEDDESWLIEMIRNYMDDVAKRREIQQAKKKINERVENGYHQGRPRYGTEHDNNGHHLVPGDGFEDALMVLALNDADAPKTNIVDKTGISRGTVYDIIDRQDWYRKLAKKHNIEMPDIALSANK
ncbi:recombinase family protein [Natranaeroarchaeum aerophilus]|uniref:Recombinase family protein n=1 Tax=Natranaeroarchaeum aerophilus TaxID=2917711 RepID=A0AAE3FSA4_9EURY|nr:recombinase family protein [Natranaeroarchaeum aerophilus]MCL9814403.1 recombinase family protein [Natranaeroarchaeum aerophilus]